MTSVEAEICELLSLSARIGRDLLLVQASSGNTSIKRDGKLWIKASGKWLAHAQEQPTLIPLNLAEIRAALQSGDSLPSTGQLVEGTYLEASIETAMHAVLPARVVVHVHSVNAISWAVRRDGPERLAERLAGLAWRWIPYVASGVPLARLIEQVGPDANVFVLANHGLVVCGDNCRAAETLLAEVEQRLSVTPRRNGCHAGFLLPETDGRWTLPYADELHGLGTDPVSIRILQGGILYPCQAIFLGTQLAVVPNYSALPDSGEMAFAIVKGRGIVTNRNLTASQRALLFGLLYVIERVDVRAPLRYLSPEEISTLLNEDTHRYQLSTEKFGRETARSANHSY